jgi:hypothetical protein
MDTSALRKPESLTSDNGKMASPMDGAKIFISMEAITKALS